MVPAPKHNCLSIITCHSRNGLIKYSNGSSGSDDELPLFTSCNAKKKLDQLVRCFFAH